jgi:hypothetical protein
MMSMDSRAEFEQEALSEKPPCPRKQVASQSETGLVSLERA